MSWTYAAYESEATIAAQIAMLRLHIAEVANKIDASVAADGRSRSSGDLVTYRRELEARLERLQKKPGASGMTGFGVIRISNPQ